MNTYNKNQQPFIDPNNLDEDHEIRFEYDSNGNLIRAYKVNRYQGFAVGVLLIVILMLLSFFL